MSKNITVKYKAVAIGKGSKVNNLKNVLCTQKYNFFGSSIYKSLYDYQ